MVTTWLLAFLIYFLVINVVSEPIENILIIRIRTRFIFENICDLLILQLVLLGVFIERAEVGRFLEDLWHLFREIWHSTRYDFAILFKNYVLFHRGFYRFFATTFARNFQIVLSFNAFERNLKIISILSLLLVHDRALVVLTELSFVLIGWNCRLEIVVNDLISLAWGRWAAVCNVLTKAVVDWAAECLYWRHDRRSTLGGWYHSWSCAVLKWCLWRVHIYK